MIARKHMQHYGAFVIKKSTIKRIPFTLSRKTKSRWNLPPPCELLGPKNNIKRRPIEKAYHTQKCDSLLKPEGVPFTPYLEQRQIAEFNIFDCLN